MHSTKQIKKRSQGYASRAKLVLTTLAVLSMALLTQTAKANYTGWISPQGSHSLSDVVNMSWDENFGNGSDISTCPDAGAGTDYWIDIYLTNQNSLTNLLYSNDYNAFGATPWTAQDQNPFFVTFGQDYQTKLTGIGFSPAQGDVYQISYAVFESDHVTYCTSHNNFNSFTIPLVTPPEATSTPEQTQTNYFYGIALFTTTAFLIINFFRRKN